MENMKKIEHRKESVNNAREHLLNALRWDIDIIEGYDIHNDFDLQFINAQIDDTIKLLELLKIRFVDPKDIFKGGRNE